MAKFYITGIAGTGKSSIIAELNKRCIKALDIDTPEFCYWMNKNGEKAKYENGVGKKWIEKYDYLCDKGKLRTLLDSQKDNLVFIAGIADNQDEYLDWFDKVFILQCDQDVLLDRLINRDTNNFAKEKSEQEYVLNSYEEFVENLRKKGAIPINSAGTVQEVTDQILSQANLNL